MPRWSQFPLVAKIAAVLLALVGVYAFLGAVVAPWLLAREARSLIYESGELEGKVVDVDLNPFTLVLTVTAVEVDTGEYQRAAALDALEVDVEVLPLFGGEIVFETIRLVGPRVLIDIGRDGELEIAGFGLGGDDASEDPADAPEEAGEPLRILIRSFEIENGDLEFHDHSVATEALPDRRIELQASPISLRLSNLQATGSPTDLEGVTHSAGEVELAFSLEEHGQVKATGTLRIDPLALDLDLDVDDLGIAPLEPYVQRFARLDVVSGALGADGHVAYHDGEGVRFEGALSLSELELRRQGEDSTPVAWSALEANGVDLDVEKNSLAIEELVLRAPRVSANRSKAGTLDLAELATPPDSSPGATDSQDENGEPFVVTVGRVVVEDGSLAFRDASLTPAFAFAADRVALDAKKFSTAPGTRTELDLSGRANEHAPFTVKGTFDANEPTSSSKLVFSLTNLSLPSFNAYAAPAIGNPIDQGKGSAEVDVSIESGVVTAQNRFRLDRLEFGPSVEGKGTPRVPYLAAVDLLKDSDGRIEIAVPVEGNLADPGFSYRGVLLKGLRQLVTNVVRAPFGALAGIANVGTDELQHVGFEPGSYEIVEEEREKLAALGEALGKRPRLRVGVRGVADAARDGPEVRRLPFGNASEDSLRTLADRRSRAIRAALVEAGGVSDDRVFVREPQVIPAEEGASPDAAAEPAAVFSQLSLTGASRIPDGLPGIGALR